MAALLVDFAPSTYYTHKTVCTLQIASAWMSAPVAAGARTVVDSSSVMTGPNAEFQRLPQNIVLGSALASCLEIGASWQ